MCILQVSGCFIRHDKTYIKLACVSMSLAGQAMAKRHRRAKEQTGYTCKLYNKNKLMMTKVALIPLIDQMQSKSHFHDIRLSNLKFNFINLILHVCIGQLALKKSTQQLAHQEISLCSAWIHRCVGFYYGILVRPTLCFLHQHLFALTYLETFINLNKCSDSAYFKILDCHTPILHYATVMTFYLY